MQNPGRKCLTIFLVRLLSWCVHALFFPCSGIFVPSKSMDTGRDSQKLPVLNETLFGRLDPYLDLRLCRSRSYSPNPKVSSDRALWQRAALRDACPRWHATLFSVSQKMFKHSLLWFPFIALLSSPQSERIGETRVTRLRLPPPLHTALTWRTCPHLTRKRNMPKKCPGRDRFFDGNFINLVTFTS